jgi:hypothetical protein
LFRTAFLVYVMTDSNALAGTGTASTGDDLSSVASSKRTADDAGMVPYASTGQAASARTQSNQNTSEGAKEACAKHVRDYVFLEYPFYLLPKWFDFKGRIGKRIAEEILGAVPERQDYEEFEKWWDRKGMTKLLIAKHTERRRNGTAKIVGGLKSKDDHACLVLEKGPKN